MNITNIEQFQQVAGKVLDTLRSQFPIPQDLYADQIVRVGDIPESVQEEPTIGGMGGIGARESTPEEEFSLHCVDWLAQEGYIQTGKKGRHYFEDVVLTSKGLELLGIQPLKPQL